MFFLLSKLLAFIIMPLTWVIVLFAWSFFSKNEMRKRKMRIAAFALLLFFSNRFIFDRTAHLWEVNAVAEPKAGSYAAIIVLGGVSSWDDDMQRIQFSRQSDRLLQAIELWKKGVAPKIIFTGGSGSVLHQDSRESDHIQKFLHDYGVPDSVMIYENKSRNTHENATFTKKMLDSIALHGKFLLVTSAFHMRRSLGCFTKAGVKVDPYSTDRFSGPWKFEFDYVFLPDAESLFNWNELFHEWFGCISYKVAGYM